MSSRHSSARSAKGKSLAQPGNTTRRRWYSFIAIGAIVLILSLGLIGLRRNIQSSSAATLPAETPSGSEALTAANYTPLPTADPVKPLFGGHEMGEQTPPPAPRPRPEGQPSAIINLPETFYAFGTIPVRPAVSHRFVVQNTGTADLVISKLFTSCGCTTASLASSIIPPGTQTELEVVFDPGFHEVHGEVTRLVWLTTNDPVQPWVEIEVTANVP